MMITDDIANALVGIVPVDVIPECTESICLALQKYSIQPKSTALVRYTESVILKKFIVNKGIEGLAKSSLQYYHLIISKFLKTMQTQIEEVTTDKVLAYFGIMRSLGCNETTINNERRVLNAFFGWCCDQMEIIKVNPMKKIKQVRGITKERMPFTGEQIELMRIAAKNDRDRAIIEFLFSTGCRASEVCSLDISDIQWDGSQCSVFGKGRKYRTVYLSDKCRLLLKMYIEARRDNDPALFISKLRKRLSVSGLERLIRRIGQEAGIENAHPHRFRHTAATIALRKGMPIEMVQKMLGHSSIQTTTIYAKTSQDELQRTHRKIFND
jgi:site-specific recombinase XerD